eukprot:GEMP01002649.1.p1 GENE.GEMP01002649.1~~GEMP01002649.1.p1  ORF type:complete len:745 (-),score=277.79 GEMP01002649.1:558-2792(-)
MSVVFCLFVAALGADIAVTPVEKVSELLVKLKAKVIDESKREKVLFQKFNDFCHFQENEKFWMAAKGAKKVDRLDDEIENHEAQIEKKQLQVSDLEEEIANNKDSIEKETASMTERSEKDASALADLATVISQCKRAIQHLKDSDVSGTALLVTAKTVLHAALRVKNQPSGVEELVALVSESGKPHAYQFHSQTVIELLEKLVKQFENERVEKDNDTMSARSQSQSSIQELENLVASQVNQKNEFQSQIDKHTAAKQAKEDDRGQSAKDLYADTDFAHHLVGCVRLESLAKEEGQENLSNYLLRHLKKNEGGCPSEEGECGEKRANYAQRVKTRDGEIIALTQAIEIMQGQGGQKYTSNKRLTALVRKHTFAQEDPHDDDEDDDEDEDGDDDEDEDATTFLQFPRHSDRRILKFLSREAKVLKSSTLSALLLKVKMGDHFKDIRKLINDLIDRLETQLQDEQDQKAWCDKQLKQTHAGRNDAQKGIETATSNIDSESAKKSLLEKEIDELRQQIVSDRETREKQTDTRGEEKADNGQTVADAKEGLLAVSEAIKILTAFYESNAENFFQKQPERVAEHEEFRAQGADASGQTVADIRPGSDAFGSTSRGSQAEAKGIIGILQVIRSDYERTVESVEASEKLSAKEYTKADQELADQIDADEGTVTNKSDQVDEAGENITDNEGDLADSKVQFQSRESELAQLKPLCSSAEAEEQKEERRKRRQQEIAALREALQILRDASFLSQ